MQNRFFMFTKRRTIVITKEIKIVGKVKTPGIVGSDKLVDIGTHKLHVVLTDASRRDASNV